MELTLDRCETECLHPEKVAPLVGKLLRSHESDLLAATFALLADPTRSRILHALTLTDELCVCDLALLVGISQSAMSHQLRLLRTQGVITRRKTGRIVYYRLADEHIRHVFADALRHTREESAAEAEAS